MPYFIEGLNMPPHNSLISAVYGPWTDVIIHVTKEHIAQGVRSQCNECPVALAVMSRLIGTRVIYVDDLYAEQEYVCGPRASFRNTTLLLQHKAQFIKQHDLYNPSNIDGNYEIDDLTLPRDVVDPIYGTPAPLMTQYLTKRYFVHANVTGNYYSLLFQQWTAAKPRRSWVDVFGTAHYEKNPSPWFGSDTMPFGPVMRNEYEDVTGLHDRGENWIPDDRSIVPDKIVDFDRTGQMEPFSFRCALPEKLIRPEGDKPDVFRCYDPLGTQVLQDKFPL